MQVEVNEYTIIKYGLVQLTGNSVETLLTIAQEAKDTGNILTVTVPDDVQVNVFDAAQGRSVDEDELRAQDHMENPIMDIRETRPGVVHIPVQKVEIKVVQVEDESEGEAVDGEIVEED